MTGDRWQKVKRLLIASEDIPPAELSAWLNEACDGDEDLLREVESLLKHEEDSETLQPEQLLRDWVETEEQQDLGRRIGLFRLVEQLGRGGMGEVYLAEREEGFEQRVALKLLRRGLGDLGVARERFHQERQILARLEHPNIARLIDGGTSDGGRPYFAMELVEGKPIDQYCDEHCLGIKERLLLVLQVCEALQFAHRNLIVHRDLKPGNILVTEDGKVKLLDFGIAKMLSPDAVQAVTATTETGQQPMTLRYASPEQLREERITTASDIYSLGVVLHELMTGRLPVGLDAKNTFELIQAVCSQDPRPLSQEVRLLPEEVVQKRSASAAVLKRQLRGDVNAIVLKALRKVPSDRYASVEQLAADIQRHLQSFPVQARQGTWIYLAGRYVRRHRWGLALMMVVLVSALALALQLERTERERNRAVRISGFLVELFRSVEPDRPGEQPEIRDLIELGQERLSTEFEEDPRVRADLLSTLGEVSSRLGNDDTAAESLRDALASLGRLHRGDHVDIARALNNLAVVNYKRGDFAAAEDFSRQAIAMRERLGNEELLKPRNTLAAVLMLRGQLDEAETIYRQVLEERRVSGSRPRNLATSLRSLGTVLFLRGDFAAAEPLLREALELRITVFERNSPAVANVLVSLGRLARAQGRLDEAEDFFLEAREIRHQHFGTEHLEMAILDLDLAAIHLDRQDSEAAGRLLEPALKRIRQEKEEGDWQRLEAESLYGAYLTSLGRFREAEPLLRSAHDQLREVRGPDVLPTRQARERLEEFLQRLRETP